MVYNKRKINKIGAITETGVHHWERNQVVNEEGHLGLLGSVEAITDIRGRLLALTGNSKENICMTGGLEAKNLCFNLECCNLRNQSDNKCHNTHTNINPLTLRVKHWMIQSFLTMVSMNRVLKCDHSLESC